MATEQPPSQRLRIDPVEFIMNLDPDDFQAELFRKRKSIDPS